MNNRSADFRVPRWTLGLRSFCVACVLILASLSFAASARAAGGAELFGIASGGHLQNEDPATQGLDLDAIQKAGSRWIRIDINWAQIQNGGPSTYYWTDIDRLVGAASSRGLNVLGVIVYTPSWARPGGTPATFAPDPQKYATFAATAAAHYSALGVHSYEIWNEPNIQPFWSPSPSVGDYTKLLKAAYPAVKAADPGATVLSGGTSPAITNGKDIAPVDFLRGIYAAGGGGSFDAVAHHPYTWPAYPGEAESWSAWYQMYGTSPSLRSVMIDNGDGAKKIWGTEFGAPTNGPSGDSYVTDQQQAQMITKGYSNWATYDWAGPLFTHQVRDLGARTDTRENFFGLIRNDFSKKPAYAAYQQAAGAAGSTGAGTASSGPVTPTKVVVKGKGTGKGKVSGRVAPASVGRTRGAKLRRKVELKLFRKGGHRWHSASVPRRVRLGGHGHFRMHIHKLRRHLRPGIYRVRAHYPGSRGLRPSSSQSRRFRLRV